MSVINGDKKFILLIRIGISIVILLSFLTGGVIAVSVWTFAPVVYSNIELKQHSVVAGTSITYTAHFKKNTRRVGTMTRYLVSLNGDATITLTPAGLADAKIEDTSKTVTVQIPEYIQFGKYKIRWVVVYDYFGIRQVSVWCETPPFMITNRK
jgi:uncharacterized protein (DUF58 family)